MSAVEYSRAVRQQMGLGPDDLHMGIPRNQCWYCGVPFLSSRLFPGHRRNSTADHVQPLSRGGTSRQHNKVRACRDCNERKRAMTLEEWRRHEGVDLFWGERVLGRHLT